MKNVQIQIVAAMTLILSGTSWTHMHSVPEISEGTIRTIYVQGTPGEEVKPVAEQVQKEKQSSSVQEFEMTMSVFPGKFRPDRLTVKKGVPVRLLLRALHREHVNFLSIRPFVRSVSLEPPGKVTVIEFVPNQTGTFKIRNVGHGVEATLVVVE